MRHLDLCSGIGGFALSARWIGWETVQFVEIDLFCQKVLRKHWPEVPIHDDLRTFTAVPFRGRIDLLTSGYPCQPFSSAGKRRGEADNRHLWPEVFRVVKECRPRWVVCGNVAGHVTMGLDAVLSDLESEGYACQAVVIPACATGAAHRRDRVWIIANHGSKRAECLSALDQDRERRAVIGAESGRLGALSPYTESQRCGEARQFRRDESEERIAGGCETVTNPEGNGCGSRRPESKGLVGQSIADDATAPDVADTDRFNGGTERLISSSDDGQSRNQLIGRDTADASNAHPTRTQRAAFAGSIGSNGPESDDEYLRRCDLASPGNTAATRLPDRIGPPVDRSQQDTQPERPDGWETESGVCRGDDGLPRGMDFDRVWQVAPLVMGKVPDRVNRLKALGNAIVPQVAYEIFRAIEAADRQ